MGNDKLLRVTQMNALYLDKEILKLFQELTQNTCKHLPLGFTASIDPELNLLVRLAILKHSLLDKNTTIGQELLNIKYDNLTNTKKLLYLIFNTLPYVKTRCELSWPSHDVNNSIFKVYMVLKILNLLNLSIFLRNGEKPQLIERILGMRQIYASENVQRSYQSKYLARELLWNGFIEFFIYIVPLINYQKIKRVIKQYIPFSPEKMKTLNVKREITIQTKCSHCGLMPILPHHMGCAHVFCYVCLKGNLVVDSKYECPTCEHQNRDNPVCQPVYV